DIAGAASAARRDAFRYGDADRFPIGDDSARADAIQFLSGATVKECAERVAAELVARLGDTTVRDRATGVRRQARAADVAILFRSRDSHREFESALDRAGVPTYVYKGLGFFDADEIQDAIALLRYLADPRSNLRAATLL